MVKIIDVSGYQHAPDWAAIAREGYAAAICKSGDGIGSPDRSLSAHVDGARAAGLAIGTYHYLRIRHQRAQDALAQAREACAAWLASVPRAIAAPTGACSARRCRCRARRRGRGRRARLAARWFGCAVGRPARARDIRPRGRGPRRRCRAARGRPRSRPRSRLEIRAARVTALDGTAWAWAVIALALVLASSSVRSCG